MRGGDVPYPGAFQTEFLVQCTEEFRDREIANCLHEHTRGGYLVKVWLVT